MDEIVSLKPQEPLRTPCIGRDRENEKSLILYLNRPATDDEMRFLHDAIQRAVATTPDAAHFSKRYSRKEFREYVERQGNWTFDEEGYFCQKDDGECVT
jgi:hypothetical protein